jgi:2-polyprenyl-3-methyl-5-hydroxy-6-metoxy-1,4-benzoquinol methylase
MTAHFVLENIKCTLCDSDRSRKIFIGRDRLFGKNGEFNVVECESCGLIYTNPRPTKDTIGYFYPDDYAPYNTFDIETTKIYQQKDKFFQKLKNEIKYQIFKRYFGYRTLKPNTRIPYFDELPYWLKSIFLNISRIYFNKVYYRVPLWHEDGKALDVGCGNGAILVLLKNLGWDVSGIDVNVQVTEDVKKAKIPIFSGQLDEMRFEDKSFHLITMWNVVEHLPNPLQSVRDVYRLLADDGTFIVEIPNCNSLARTIFRSNWCAWELPRHLYHFSPKTITRLLKKAGFSNVKLKHLPKLNLGWSLSYCFEGRGIEGALKTIEKYTLIAFVKKLLAVFTMMLRKSEIIFIEAKK